MTKRLSILRRISFLTATALAAAVLCAEGRSFFSKAAGAKTRQSKVSGKPKTGKGANRNSGAKASAVNIPMWVTGTQMVVRVTGYCNCGKCCSWKRSWFGFGPPVYKSGRMKGRRKEVGVTASGTVAKRGTIAADPKVFPFGTRIFVPGYGLGVVEDTGGSVRGQHIDVWFPSHSAALSWGSKKLPVKVLPMTK